MAAHLESALGGLLQGGSAMAPWPASLHNKQTSGAFWEEEVVQLMMGRPLHHLDVDIRPSSPPPWLPIPKTLSAPCSTTLDLLGAASAHRSPPSCVSEDRPGSSSSACCFDLDADAPLPSGWEKCLDLQTGSIYYLNRNTGVSTSCDPRKATTSSVNWPTSSSSSSDLTIEANVPLAISTKSMATSLLEGPSKEPANLDLTLSLKPSSPSLRPNSLNHDLKSDFNHNFKSLITSQSPINKQSLNSSNVSSLPFTSTRACFSTPTRASSIASSTSSSSPSTLFFQELSALKDMGSLATSNMSRHQSLNGMSRHVSHNVRERPFSREAFSSSLLGRNSSVSAKAKPIINDAHLDASSAMMTVGCPNCLMFVMLPRSHSPKCPRCGAFIDSDLPQPPSMKKPKLGLSLMS